MSRDIEKEILRMGLTIAKYGASKSFQELYDLDRKRTIISLINKAETIELVKEDSNNELYKIDDDIFINTNRCLIKYGNSKLFENNEKYKKEIIKSLLKRYNFLQKTKGLHFVAKKEFPEVYKLNKLILEFTKIEDVNYPLKNKLEKYPAFLDEYSKRLEKIEKIFIKIDNHFNDNIRKLSFSENELIIYNKNYNYAKLYFEYNRNQFEMYKIEYLKETQEFIKKLNKNDKL